MILRNVIFDFDGTLVDTSYGIINCLDYACHKLGIQSICTESIKKVIGKPLREMLEILIQSNDRVMIDDGVHYFRERYGTEGLVELSLYGGVAETLQHFHSNNMSLFIVTSKPTEYARTIVKNLEIDKYFVFISGVNLIGDSPAKKDRVKHLIFSYDLRIQETALIGDRAEDVLAAKENNIISIGMLSGYGSYEELLNAGCDIILKDFYQLNRIGNIN